MHTTPKITIITVCYNAADHILDCLNSVKDQTYDNIEHIIVDGKSSDGTLNIVKKFIDKFYSADCAENLKKIKWESEPDKGIYDALNKGIERATGDVIGFVHADDLLTANDTIANIANAFSDELDGIYGNMIFVKPNNISDIKRVWKPGKQGNFRLGWSLPHQTLFLRREVYIRFGGYFNNMTNAADYEFILRICLGDGENRKNEFKRWSEPKPVNLKYLDETLIIMKLGGASTKNINSSAKGYRDVLEGLRIHRLKFPKIVNAFRLLSKVKQRIIR